MTDLNSLLAAVKVVAMDVDGTITDGTIFYDHEGNVTKGFGARDGLGLELLKRAGIPRGFVTGRRDPATEIRARFLGVEFHHGGVGDKSATLREICAEFGVTLAEILFIGDDLNDYTAFEIAGVAVAVGDACEELKRAAHYVTAAPGGKGAVREVAELLLKAKGYDLVTLWKTRSDVPVGKQ